MPSPCNPGPASVPGREERDDAELNPPVPQAGDVYVHRSGERRILLAHSVHKPSRRDTQVARLLCFLLEGDFVRRLERYTAYCDAITPYLDDEVRRRIRASGLPCDGEFTERVARYEFPCFTDEPLTISTSGYLVEPAITVHCHPFTGRADSETLDAARALVASLEKLIADHTLDYYTIRIVAPYRPTGETADVDTGR